MRPFVALPALLAIAAASCGRDSSPPVSLGRAADWFPLDEGRRWTYEAWDGSERMVIAYRSFGGDQRQLAGVGPTRFQFVYGTPEGFDHETTKSIYAMAPDGPRLFHLDAMLWGVGFDPPLPLLPPEPRLGAVWEWSGTAQPDREPVSSAARLEIVALEPVVVPAGTCEAIQVRQVHDRGGLEVDTWYARGVGLVRCEWTAPRPDGTAPRRRLVLLEHVGPSPGR
jgi:hypothetical protein